MAAVVELDETNGVAPGTTTHSVTSLAMGTSDATGMISGDPGARQPPNSASMQKALRLHLTDLGGSLGITAPRIHCAPSVVGWSLFMNGHTVQGTYDATKRTTYVQVSTSTGPVPNAVPTGDPGVANFGIAGSLTGQLLAPGFTDFIYIQLRAAAPAGGFSAPCYLAYDDIG